MKPLPPIYPHSYFLLHGAFALGATALLTLGGVYGEIPFLIPLAGLFFVFYVIGFSWRPLRLRRLLLPPIDPSWRDLLEEKVAFYRRLPEVERLRFERNLRVVLADHHFEGIDGAVVSDEARVLSGAGAAVLMQGWDDFTFPGRRSVLLYPDHFDDDYDVARSGDIAGMVHEQGPIIFSLRALRRGWSGESDGYNVAIHEFAHVLDMENGAADGFPAQLGMRDADRWSEVMEEELGRARRGRSPLRSYAAENEAEFFAVAAESFFEQPGRMRRESPDLYEALAAYFEQDLLS